MQLACAPLQTSLPLLPAVLTGMQKSKLWHATHVSVSLKILQCPAPDTQYPVPLGLGKSCILLLSAHAGLKGERSNCKSS